MKPLQEKSNYNTNLIIIDHRSGSLNWTFYTRKWNCNLQIMARKQDKTKLKLLLIHAIEGRQKEIIVTLFSTVTFSILACSNNFHLDWHFRYTAWETKEIVLSKQKLTELQLTSCQVILSGNGTIWERLCLSKKMLTALGDCLWLSGEDLRENFYDRLG